MKAEINVGPRTISPYSYVGITIITEEERLGLQAKRFEIHHNRFTQPGTLTQENEIKYKLFAKLNDEKYKWIKDIVLKYYNKPENILRNNSKSPSICLYKQVISYFSYFYCYKPLREIGIDLYGKDRHDNIIYGKNLILKTIDPICKNRKRQEEIGYLTKIIEEKMFFLSTYHNKKNHEKEFLNT